MIDEIRAEVAKYISRLGTFLNFPLPNSDPNAMKKVLGLLRDTLTSRSQKHVMLLAPHLKQHQVENFCRELLVDLDWIECADYFIEHRHTADTTSHVEIPKTIFDKGTRLVQFVPAVNHLMALAYLESHHATDEWLLDRATQIAAETLEVRGDRGRIKRTWYSHCLSEGDTKKTIKTFIKAHPLRYDKTAT
jgi:hypothetical protein